MKGNEIAEKKGILQSIKSLIDRITGKVGTVFGNASSRDGSENVSADDVGKSEKDRRKYSDIRTDVDKEAEELHKKISRPEAIFYIGGNDVLPPPLTAEEERELTIRLSADDREARSTLIEHNLRLVVYIARRFENAGVNVEDLVSIGTIGLIKAVNTFNYEKNIKLATYASRCIENEILMYLRRIGKTKSEVSFDEPLNVDWDGNELLLSDILGTEEDVIFEHLEDEVNRRLLHQAMEKLSPREKQIIEMRFGLHTGEEMTQKDVADFLGISQSYISRLEKKIISRLRREIAKLA